MTIPTFPPHENVLLNTKIVTWDSLKFRRLIDEQKVVVLGSSENQDIQHSVFLGKICEANANLPYNGYDVYIDTGFPSVILIFGVRSMDGIVHNAHSYSRHSYSTYDIKTKK